MSKTLLPPETHNAVAQHLNWLARYFHNMEAGNWEEMRDYADRQIGWLAAELGIIDEDAT